MDVERGEESLGFPCPLVKFLICVMEAYTVHLSGLLAYIFIKKHKATETFQMQGQTYIKYESNTAEMIKNQSAGMQKDPRAAGTGCTVLRSINF